MNDQVYYKDGWLVYAIQDGVHLVPDSRWSEYLTLRTTVPKVVRTFDKVRDIIEQLSGDRMIQVPKFKKQQTWWAPVKQCKHAFLLCDERWTGNLLMRRV